MTWIQNQHYKHYRNSHLRNEVRAMNVLALSENNKSIEAVSGGSAQQEIF